MAHFFHVGDDSNCSVGPLTDLLICSNDYASRRKSEQIHLAIQLPSSVNNNMLDTNTGCNEEHGDEGMLVTEECRQKIDVKNNMNACKHYTLCQRLSYTDGKLPMSLFRTLSVVLIRIASSTSLEWYSGQHLKPWCSSNPLGVLRPHKLSQSRWVKTCSLHCPLVLIQALAKPMSSLPDVFRRTWGTRDTVHHPRSL